MRKDGTVRIDNQLYEIDLALLTVGLTADGRLTAELSGQPPGAPMRTVSANEFANDAVIVGHNIRFDCGFLDAALEVRIMRRDHQPVALWPLLGLGAALSL